MHFQVERTPQSKKTLQSQCDYDIWIVERLSLVIKVFSPAVQTDVFSDVVEPHFGKTLVVERTTTRSFVIKRKTYKVYCIR